MSNVLAIYARENGQGLFFDPEVSEEEIPDTTATAAVVETSPPTAKPNPFRVVK